IVGSLPHATRPIGYGGRLPRKRIASLESAFGQACIRRYGIPCGQRALGTSRAFVAGRAAARLSRRLSRLALLARSRLSLLGCLPCVALRCFARNRLQPLVALDTTPQLRDLRKQLLRRRLVLRRLAFAFACSRRRFTQILLQILQRFRDDAFSCGRIARTAVVELRRATPHPIHQVRRLDVFHDSRALFPRLLVRVSMSYHDLAQAHIPLADSIGYP